MPLSRANGSTAFALGAAFVVCLVATPAVARDIEVPSERYPTVESALRKARKGDVVRIAPGEYEVGRLRIRRAGVRVEGPGAVLWAEDAKARLIVQSKDCSVVELRFERVPVDVRGKRSTVADCTFAGEFRRPPCRLRGRAASIEACTFDTASVFDAADALIRVDGRQVRVTDNRVHARRPSSPSARDAVFVAGRSAVLRGNTFTTDPQASVTAIHEAGVETWIVENTFDGLWNAVTSTGRSPRIDRNSIERHDSGPALRIETNAALVVDNDLERTGRTRSAVIQVDGDSNRIEGNTIRMRTGRGVLLTGNVGRITGNSISGLSADAEHGIFVEGDDVTVLVNRITEIGDGVGIDLRGDRGWISGNSVLGREDLEDRRRRPTGLTLWGHVNTVENNTVRAVGHGLRLLGDESEVTGFAAEDCGDDAISVRGSDNTLRACSVLGSDDAGFYLWGGQSNSLEDCVAESAATGFNVRSATTTLDRCTSVGASQFGIHLRGDGSIVRWSRFLESGESDVRNTAEFLVTSGNVFETGTFDLD